MVTYCLGSARQKRAYFLKRNVVILDNTEVVFCADVNGKSYFAYGAPPFVDFTVRAYLKYKTALCGGADLSLAAKLGIDEDKRIGALCPAQMRCVQYVERLAARAAGNGLVINLDGTRYTRKNARFLSALLALCGDAFVCVTDVRFVKRAKRVDKIMRFGKPVGARAAFYKANKLAKLCEKKYGVSVTRVGVM